MRTYFVSRQFKQQTAKALFIHRQTLYYRLEQISALLGEDWDSPPRLLALHTAIAASHFMEFQENRSATDLSNHSVERSLAPGTPI